MKLFLASAMLLISIVSIGQSTDTTKVEQYCELVATGRLLSKKVNIDVDFGEERKFFKNYMLKDDNGKLVKFNSVTDAINYMGASGWKLVNAFPVSQSGSPMVYHFYFKKEFLKADVDRAEQ